MGWVVSVGTGWTGWTPLQCGAVQRKSACVVHAFVLPALEVHPSAFYPSLFYSGYPATKRPSTLKLNLEPPRSASSLCTTVAGSGHHWAASLVDSCVVTVPVSGSCLHASTPDRLASRFLGSSTRELDMRKLILTEAQLNFDRSEKLRSFHVEFHPKPL